MLRAADKWLWPYLARRKPRSGPRPAHLMLAVCDHFEPLHDTDPAGARERVREWTERFPDLVTTFRDSDGQPPKHTFFYPVEQYRADLLEPLAALCRATGSEVEIHLHHHDDTPENFRRTLEQGVRDLRSHGLLSTDSDGQVRYGFIHGNWALNHCDPRGRGCGVDREIPILRGTGCYADFTMPSAPHPTQARIVNRLYYARDAPGRKAIDSGEPVRVGRTAPLRDAPDHLLLVQGPLAPDWRQRKWGVFPRLENADLTRANPPTRHRFRTWTGERISVAGRPEWIFVKLHTHGGIPENYGMLLGEPMRRFHADLAAACAAADLRLHYVTARELVNILHAAEDGQEGDPGAFRGHLFP